MTKLRKFEPPDLAQIVKIAKISFPKRRLYTPIFFQKQYKLYPEGFIIASEQDSVIGYVLGLPKNDKAEVVSLAVSPEWRQQGIGTKLLSFLLKHFKETGFKEVFLYIRINNQTALSFYQSFDFNIAKTDKKHYGNGDDAYLMIKAI